MDGAARTKFLFDPEGVAALLARLPHLRAAITDPAREGERSLAFPTARTSARELYRVLGNVHYLHLDRLLRSLNFCLGHGFTQPTLMRTRGRKPFAEALAELHAAEHFLLRGFDVEGFEMKKGQQPVPEMLVRKEEVAVAVEVYCPREWEGLAELMDDLKDSVKNLDLRCDYRFELRVEQLDRFDAKHRLLYLHPSELASALDPKTREALVAELVDELTAKLDATRPDLRFERDLNIKVFFERDLNIKVLIALDGVRPSIGRLPDRCGGISWPSISGYAPEGMFPRIVERVRGKAAKGQAVGGEALSLLLVDLSNSELTSELSHSFYREEFERTLRHRLGSGLLGYDMIAFCESRGWQVELTLHYLVYENTVPVEVRHLLFGDQLA